MSLRNKVLNLKLESVAAMRHALWWEKQIQAHGEHKATAFYTHLGLNHLEAKSYEWEGLTLSREPTEAEKVCVKGVSQAQESAKESITKILLNLRTELIADGLKGIKKLKPATYHELTLQASKELRSELRERLVKVHKQGRLLIAAELGKKEAQVDEEDEFDLLDDLVDLTDSRVANEIQVRITAATARYRLLGLGEAALWKAVEDEIRLGSVSYIDRASAGLAHKVINIGRSDEADDRKDSWGHVEYSALLDQNVCDSCVSFDGETATDEADLEPTPSPSCAGGDACRCFHVFVQD